MVHLRRYRIHRLRSVQQHTGDVVFLCDFYALIGHCRTPPGGNKPPSTNTCLRIRSFPRTNPFVPGHDIFVGVFDRLTNLGAKLKKHKQQTGRRS
jgi:hypothetical protein